MQQSQGETPNYNMYVDISIAFCCTSKYYTSCSKVFISNYVRSACKATQFSSLKLPQFSLFYFLIWLSRESNLDTQYTYLHNHENWRCFLVKFVSLSDAAWLPSAFVEFTLNVIKKQYNVKAAKYCSVRWLLYMKHVIE